MSNDALLEEAATQYEAVAAELEQAVAHLNTVAGHFRTKELARAGAHAFAAHGHMLNAEALFGELAKLHASRSTP